MMSPSCFLSLMWREKEMRGKERTVRENNVRETRKPKEEKERGGERGQIAEHESRHDESKGVQVCFQKWVDSSVNKKDRKKPANM